MSRNLELILQEDLRNGGVPDSIDMHAITSEAFASGEFEISEEYDPYISDETLEELLTEAKHPSSVMLPWIIVAGATVDASATPHFRTKPDLRPEDSLFHARMRFDGKRVVARAVPDEWARGNPKLGTPFHVTKEGEDLVLYKRNAQGALEVLGKSEETGVLGSTCLKVIAYNSSGDTQIKDTSITANPIQYCPLRCTFCRRQYDTVDEVRKNGEQTDSTRLVNIPPSVMADHLLQRYGSVDWASRMQVSFVTGTFRDFDTMHQYVDAFGKRMREITGGGFDPAHNAMQNIHLSTHLARTTDDMRRLYDAGVHSVQDTIEIVNDDVRKDVMRKAKAGDGRLRAKGELTFDDCLQAVEAGVQVMGENGYYASLVLGLDTYEDTVRGMNALRDAGLTRLDPSTYQPFEKSGLKLFRMSAEDIVRSTLKYEQTFAAVSYAWPQDEASVSHTLARK